MGKHIDPATLSDSEATEMLAASLHGLETARLAAGISAGAMKRRAASVARQHQRNSLALADRLFGAPPELSDAELLAELGA